MEDGRIDVLQVGFCMVIFKTLSINIKCHVTLNTSEYHRSLHTPHWTHATSPFCVTVARPVLIVTCVQSSSVVRSCSWSPYRHGWSWLMPRPCQHLSDKGESKISVRFSSYHMKIKGCNCWQWPGPTGGEKKLCCPLPCSTAGHVAIGHPICFINIPHVTVIIRHNCRLYRVPVFIAIIAFSGWIVYICQEAQISLVLSHHSRQVTLGPYSNVTTFQSQCLGFEVLVHALCM